MFEVKLLFGHRLGLYYMSREVPLNSLSGTDFKVVGVKLSQAISRVYFVHVESRRRLTRLKSPFGEDIILQLFGLPVTARDDRTTPTRHG
jgi:hypothetical protein